MTVGCYPVAFRIATFGFRCRRLDPGISHNMALRTAPVSDSLLDVYVTTLCDTVTSAGAYILSLLRPRARRVSHFGRALF